MTANPDHKRRNLARTTVLNAAYLLSVMLLFGCGDEKESPGRGMMPGMRRTPSERPVIPVKVAVAVRRTMSSFLITTATFEAQSEVNVDARTGGQVTAFLVEEGDRVRKGDILVRLDDEQASLNAERDRIEFRSKQVAKARADEMEQRGIISSQDHEEALSAYESARLNFESSKLTLKYMSIESPIDGIVTQRNVSIGDRVTTGFTVFHIVDADTILGRVHIPEQNITAVRVGQRALVTTQAYPGQIFIGRVKRISPVVDPASGTLTVTLELNPRRKLRPGMFASVKLATETRPNVIAIPRTALMRHGEVDQVYQVQGDSVMPRQVTLGLTDTSHVQILSGLTVGDTVVVVGKAGLQPGVKVTVVGGRRVRSKEEVAAADSVDVETALAKLLKRPRIKAQYDEAVASDPTLATDLAKKKAFIERTQSRMRSRGGHGGRRGRG